MAAKKLRKQEFHIQAPAAVTVQLVGDFTDWRRAPITMKKGSDHVWRATVELAPGTYHYRFLVDGEWHDDPECSLLVPNIFGTQNAVRTVS